MSKSAFNIPNHHFRKKTTWKIFHHLSRNLGQKSELMTMNGSGVETGRSLDGLKSRCPLSPCMWQFYVTVCHIFRDKVFVSKLSFLLSRLKLMYWNDGIETYHEYDILTAVNREFSQIIITNQQNESSRRHHFQFCNITGFIYVDQKMNFYMARMSKGLVSF